MPLVNMLLCLTVNPPYSNVWHYLPTILLCFCPAFRDIIYTNTEVFLTWPKLVWCCNNVTWMHMFQVGNGHFIATMICIDTHTTTVHVYNETCKHWCSKHIYTISKLVGTLYTVHWNANLRHQRWGATCLRGYMPHKRNIHLDDKQL